MKLATFLSGVFGTVAFGLSLLAGLSAGNTVEVILTRGLLSAAVCYGVGYFVGVIAQQVSFEHAAHISKIVAEQDKRAAEERLQKEAEEAASAEVATTSVPGAAVPGNP